MPNPPALYRRPVRLDLPGLAVEPRAIAELKPNGRNARKHTVAQIDKLGRSIALFGFTAPVIIGSDDVVLAGHARLLAAEKAGLTHVPTISLGHLKPEEQRAYMLADNKLAELATWDDAILKVELADLATFDFDFCFTDLGFDTAELDRLTVDFTGGDGDHLDDIPALGDVAVSRLGDVWLLGPHRLLCGDARDAASYTALMAGEQARVVFTDPPWNLPVVGHIAKRNSKRREFPMASGEMTQAQFTTFLTETLGHAADAAMDGAIVFVVIDWRHVGELLAAGAAAIGELKNICVWVKQNAGMGAFFRSQMELVPVFKKGTAPHLNTFGLGKERYRTNVWKYAGAAGFHADRDHDLALHPTAKPVAMVADAIMDVSHRGEIVLDPFGGSGATLIAADTTGRIARLMELDPLYVDVIVRRFIAGGGQARLETTGQPFEAVAADRGALLLLEGSRHGE
jgi:hypothetical protein